MSPSLLRYIGKRLLLMVPTLLGILLITFAIIQFVPGGPVEQMVQMLKGDQGALGGASATLPGQPRPRSDRPVISTVVTVVLMLPSSKKSRPSMALISPCTSASCTCCLAF